MSSDWYGYIAGEIADEGAEGAAAGPLWNPDVSGVAFCEDEWHECGGYCGTCGIHLDEHGDRCNEYARR